MGDAIWTEHERAVCRQLYPDFKALKMSLSRRSLGAIHEMCRRLKLTDPAKPWTAGELSRLRRMFASSTWPEIEAAFPLRTKKAIVRFAYKHGLRRDRQPYKRTCHEVLDQIRDLCTGQGLYMPDVDEFASTGNFFSKRAYRRKNADFRAVDRAARELGGRLRIEWANEDKVI